MLGKKNKLSAIILSILLCSMSLNIYAETEENSSSNSTAPKTSEKVPSDSHSKEQKKDSVTEKSKKSEIKKKEKDDSKTKKASKEEASNTDNSSTELQAKGQDEVKKEENAEKLNLPNVNTSEVETSPYFSNIFKSEKPKSILKTIISWVLILLGILLILKVILGNRKIPQGYDPNVKIKHKATKNKKNRYNLKL